MKLVVTIFFVCFIIVSFARSNTIDVVIDKSVLNHYLSETKPNFNTK